MSIAILTLHQGLAHVLVELSVGNMNLARSDRMAMRSSQEPRALGVLCIDSQRKMSARRTTPSTRPSSTTGT